MTGSTKVLPAIGFSGSELIKISIDDQHIEKI